MKNKRILIGIGVIVMIALIGCFFLRQHSTIPQKETRLENTATIVPATVYPTLSEAEKATGNIIVNTPRPLEKVSLPIVIKGEARVFENQFNYRVKDENGKVLKEGSAVTDSRDAGKFGAFTITIASLSVMRGTKGTIEVFDYSPKDGSEADKISVPVSFD